MSILKHKTIVVTGGSLGIGFAVAKKIAQEGGTVILAARNSESLAKALTEVRTLSDAPHTSYKLDIGDPESIKTFSAWLSSHMKCIDGLVQCAGIYGPIGKTTEVDLGRFREALQVNLLGTIEMSVALAPLLSQKSRKKIVCFAGGGAASAFPMYSAYACSKVALVRFVENFAEELADQKLDINCIAPGFVLTRLHQQTMDAGNSAGAAFLEKTKKQIESGGVPPEVSADLACFLLSSASDSITGRFISAPWDRWNEASFLDRLKSDKDFCMLRRIDGEFFERMTAK